MKARMSQMMKRPAELAGLLLFACLFASTAFAQIDSGVCGQPLRGGGNNRQPRNCPQLSLIKRIPSDLISLTNQNHGEQLNQNKLPGQPTYIQVDYPGAVATDINGGPNLEGTSVGNWTDTSGAIHGFTLTAQGNFTSFDFPGSTFTEPNYINLEGVIVGLYHDAAGTSHGFVLKNGNFTTLDYPGEPGSGLSGINPLGDIAGFYCSTPVCGAGSTLHSFVLSRTGVYTSFDPPDATGSYASTVSAIGAVAGSYTTVAGTTCETQCEGYLLFRGNYTTISPPGSVFTVMGGGNLQNNLVGVYLDASGNGHGFLFANGAYTSFDYPGAAFTQATGINDLGEIVGIIADSAGNQHGFIRTP